jgi:hypothetical protein
VGARGPSVKEQHAAAGLAIDDETCRPRWLGDPLTNYALDVIITDHHERERDAEDEEGPRPPP